MDKDDLYDYFNSLDWKTAGWKYELLIEGMAPWGKPNKIVIRKTPGSDHYETGIGYGRHQTVISGDLFHFVRELYNSEIMGELLNNNSFNIAHANIAIKNQSNNIVEKALATKEANETAQVNEMLYYFQMACSKLGDDDGTKELLIKEFDGATLLKMKHGVGTAKLSRTATMFCKHMSIPTAMDYKGEYPQKKFPLVVLETCVEYLSDKAKYDVQN